MFLTTNSSPPLEQSLIVDDGDELLSINGKDLDGLSGQQICNMVENREDNQINVTFYLAKKDMPSRRCRVVLKKAESVATPNASTVKPQLSPSLTP
jgi:hypothetical protein